MNTTADIVALAFAWFVNGAATATIIIIAHSLRKERKATERTGDDYYRLQHDAEEWYKARR